MFERFTDRARRVLVLAQEEARLLDHSFIGTEHILLGLIHEGEGLGAKALEELGISLEAVRAQRRGDASARGLRRSTGSAAPFTPRAKKVLELSLREALQLGHNYIGTEHILARPRPRGRRCRRPGARQPRRRPDPRAARRLSGSSPVTRAMGPWPTCRSAPALRFSGAGPGFPLCRSARSGPAQVVRTGRRPDNYTNGYAELAKLVIAFGFDLDDMDAGEITLSSVETTEGPGFMVSVKHRIDDDAMGEGLPP